MKKFLLAIFALILPLFTPNHVFAFEAGGTDYLYTDSASGQVLTKDQNLNDISNQISSFCAAGQRKISLGIYFISYGGDKEDTTYGLNSRDGTLPTWFKGAFQDVLNIVKNQKDDKGDGCFNEIQIRFHPMGAVYTDPKEWNVWTEQGYQDDKNFIFNTRQFVKQTLGNSDISPIFDLGLEQGGDTSGQNEEYTKRLWKDYTDAFGASDTYGFSVAWGPGRITKLIETYDSAGIRPNEYAVDIYEAGNLPSSMDIIQQLKDIHSEMADSGEQDKPILIQETYSNDQKVYQDVLSALKLGINIRSVMQWQIDRQGNKVTGPEYIYFLAQTGINQNDLQFNNFRGANYFEGHYWFGDPSTAEVVALAAQRMHLNIIRMNVRMNLSTSDISASEFVNRLSQVMNIFAAHKLKVIVVLNGYLEYDHQCGSYGTFLQVQELAKKVVSNLKDHPALFAWEMLNEALSGGDGQGCATQADHDQVIKAVNAMYDLVRSIDKNTPTTVSEAFYWWYLPNWKQISSFASFHWYPSLSSPITDAQLSQMKSDLDQAIASAQEQVSPLPLVLTEFGIASPDKVTEQDQEKVYQAIYDVLKAKNIGGAFWYLGVNGSAGNYMPILPNGTFKLAAYAVQSRFPYFDLNSDGKIDIHDYQTMVSDFRNSFSIFDYNKLVANYGK